jgi:hypothetical protein
MPIRLRRGPRERLQAWLVTGPIGHLWSAVIDLVVHSARWQLARARGRAPR